MIRTLPLALALVISLPNVVNTAIIENFPFSIRPEIDVIVPTRTPIFHYGITAEWGVKSQPFDWVGLTMVPEANAVLSRRFSNSWMYGSNIGLSIYWDSLASTELVGFGIRGFQLKQALFFNQIVESESMIERPYTELNVILHKTQYESRTMEYGMGMKYLPTLSSGEAWMTSSHFYFTWF